jgi:hypothetical protein
MTGTTLPANDSGRAVVPPAGATPTVVPVTRGTGDRARTIGVVLVDPAGTRWQRTTDVERLITVATVTAGLVGAVGWIAAASRRPTARVDRLTMGPGGWVSFKGGEKPRPRGPRRPWWAVVLRARPLDRRAGGPPWRRADARSRSRGVPYGSSGTISHIAR